MELINQPYNPIRLGDYLRKQLTNSQWTKFRAASAFAKLSGVQYILEDLENFARSGNTAQIIVGVDHQGTSYEALMHLKQALAYPKSSFYVLHNEHPANPTFHPKVYCFDNDYYLDVVIGSGNLTSGGLFTNYETSLRIRLSKNDPAQHRMIEQVESLFALWFDTSQGVTKPVTEELLARMQASGLVISEQAMRSQRGDSGTSSSQFGSRSSPDAPLFARARIPYAPPRPMVNPAIEVSLSDSVPSPSSSGDGIRGFVMLLTQTDVGVGQITTGTARRSPEIFIPLKARDQYPDFWGWPSLFKEDPHKPGKFDRPGTRFQIGPYIVPVNMMTWPEKHDFRLRNEVLRSAGQVGDILKIEKADGERFDYSVEVIPHDSPDYAYWHSLCHDRPRSRNSQKYFGYY